MGSELEIAAACTEPERRTEKTKKAKKAKTTKENKEPNSDMEVGEDGLLPEHMRWSQVSNSWLARAYMDPSLKNPPGSEDPSPEKVANAKGKKNEKTDAKKPAKKGEEKVATGTKDKGNDEK